MSYDDNLDLSMEEWDEHEEDQILFESEEFAERYGVEQQSSASIPADDLPVLPLRGVVVYPMMWLPLPVGQRRSIRLVEDNLPENRIIALVTSKDEEVEKPEPDQIHEIGTAAQVHRVLRTPDGTIRLLVQGLERIRILEYIQQEPYLRARVEVLPELMEENIELEAIVRAVQELFRRLVDLEPQMPDELSIMAMNVENARQLAYLVAGSVRLTTDDAQEILSMDSVYDKLLRLSQILHKEVEVLELGRKIQSEAHGEMEKMQRDFYLREQLKAIQKELGEEDEQAADIRELEERIQAAHMSEEAQKEANRELDRMRRMPIQAAEYSVIKTYLDLMVSLPWQKATPDNLEIQHARQVLDEDHYGLEEIKDRILEFLAVRKLRADRTLEGPVEEDIRDKIRREREGVVLCFVGPPGVGKTSLGISIARAMNRKFVRLALGGIRDEAEIRGFRRTYIGSMPGRIIQSLRRVESKNPVFMLDEVDKLGRDFRGDPSSALLEVLDPEQNREFRDHYLDVPFDLSQVMFITTANMLETVPGPLQDRMEIIDLSSYTEDEKVRIAQGYLIPRQIKENGLRPEEVEFTEDALGEIIQGYTREAGVRGLERQIGKACRKIAAEVAGRLPAAVPVPEVAAGTVNETPAEVTDTSVSQADVSQADVSQAGDDSPHANGTAGSVAETTAEKTAAESEESPEEAHEDSDAVLDEATAEDGGNNSGNNGAHVNRPSQPLTRIDKDNLVVYLGRRKFYQDEIAERTELPGVATGLAWTATGGDILFFEATRVNGEKGFVVTGQLGDVMKESAQAALSYVRSRAESLGIDPDFFRKSDIHVHIPAGATPKDGPSAGITIATALASLLTGRPVRSDTAMTGEITLRGKVLPIGGLKEKVLTAARFGLTRVILPRHNAADLDDVPDVVRDQIEFILVDTVDEVLEAALTSREAAIANSTAAVATSNTNGLSDPTEVIESLP
ncbi:MAG: endopeptidase La [Litorilinea sp.]